jgi:dolichol kinase
MRANLSRRYEDLLAQVRSMRLFSPEMSEKLRSLRLPSWARSVFHLVCGLGGVALYQLVLPYEVAVGILLSLVGLFTFLEVSRRFSPAFNDFMVDRLFGPISRPQERYRVNSATFYLLALTLIVIFTPLQAACAGALVLAFGDPLASAIGSRWGRTKLVHDKSLQGSLAFFGSAFAVLVGYFLLSAPQLAWPQALSAAASLAAVGALVELFSDKLDDNFTVPVAVALMGMLWF